MTHLARDVDAALTSDGRIPRENVLRWIEAAKDLATLSKLYRLTDAGYYRIQPDLGQEATCALILRYLLECIRQNVEDDDEIDSRFEACYTLHIWLRHLLERGDSSETISKAARAVTELYLASAADIQYTIETAFLEHALESAALRPYFEHWASDDRLKEAWTQSLAWGEAHPDATCRMSQRHTQGWKD
jgi:hypothetical protein